MSTRSAHLVQRETQWQTPPKPSLQPGERTLRVGLARWSKTVDSCPFEMAADDAQESHFITYSMKPTSVNFSIGRRAVTSGTVQAGRILLQGPTAERRQSIYRKSFDFFRVYFSREILDECYQSGFGERSSPLTLFQVEFVEDQLLDNLTRALARADEDGGMLGQTFVDSVGLALTYRLMSLYSGVRPQSRGKVSPLPGWKLRRVREFIDESLSRPIHLEEMSNVAGLSRMHFAAQFRAAVGVPPHTYILQRKIERAQELLVDRSLSVADVAQIVGFKNVAHFSNVFKRIAGGSPMRWRQNADL